RLWVNPSPAFLPGTDPRVTAARHGFPYVRDAEGTQRTEDPAAVHPYEPGLWEAVREAQRDVFEDPPVFSYRDLHAR
ncbi:hypothetical protein ACFV9E_43440, partial [Streptomyces sp. NPDC059835]|uniref:hypothetical protein n=1 Tax=Streptomyces sp. NPDC059835 TaxID=3346967 RepID=UPI00365E2F54